jgi:hypothetical protein
MQLVQTLIRIGTPSTLALMRLRLILKRRKVRLWALLTLCPMLGFFPHISQTCAIVPPDQSANIWIDLDLASVFMRHIFSADKLPTYQLINIKYLDIESLQF